jgi:DNA-binding transcriptional ArsR family regulator
MPHRAYDHGVHDAFSVIGEPVRRALLDLLAERPHAVGELVAATQASQPSASKHLRALREAGLVTVRADGRRRVYALRLEGLDEVAGWLTPFVLARGRELDGEGAPTLR